LRRIHCLASKVLELPPVMILRGKCLYDWKRGQRLVNKARHTGLRLSAFLNPSLEPGAEKQCCACHHWRYCKREQCQLWV
jgi:hypothetical protein